MRVRTVELGRGCVELRYGRVELGHRRVELGQGRASPRDRPIELRHWRLELWFILESQRFLDPVFREFYKERDVVTEERRETREEEQS